MYERSLRIFKIMSERLDANPFDLGYESAKNLAPVARLIRLILQQAVLDEAHQIEFWLEDESSETGFQVAVRTGSGESRLAPSSGTLFSPCIVVLCNYAAVPYYTKGHVTGTIKTINPTSRWTLESDDLHQRILLSKT